MAGTKVFISHISEERELALELSRRIGQAFEGDVQAFVSSDMESVAAGEPWLHAIEKALSRTEVLLVLCSQESLLRPWIHFETGAGWITKVRVIPICHSGLKVGRLPMPLKVLQGVDLENEEGAERLYHALATHFQVEPVAGSVTDAADTLRKLSETYRNRRRRTKWKALVNDVVGTAVLFVAPFVLAASFALALWLLDGDREAAGDLLRFAPLPVVWYFGAYFRLTRQRTDGLAYVLAPTLIATLAGALSTVAYSLLAEPNNLDWIFLEQKLRMLTFFLSTVLSFLLGVWLGSWLSQDGGSHSWIVEPLKKFFPNAISEAKENV